MFDYQTYRRWTDRTMVFLCGAAAFVAMIPLVSLLAYVIIRGVKRLDWTFLTSIPTPVGVTGGGMGNAIVGTITLVLIACCVGLPIGIMAGIYLSEYGKKNKFAWIVRFTADILSGVPSIVTGIVAYTLIVRPMHNFSALAGGVALGFMMIPIVTRTTEELVKLVPHSIREASWALGVSQWKTILNVVIRTARNGILTGVLLSIARIAGETAPLLFTAFNNQFWPHGVNEPTASLTVQVFTYAISPFKDWQDQAWTGALVLLILVLAVNMAAKLFFKNPRQLLR
ncbi:MAG TPA: phosphate ABC transporter permease PstA [bacterium]|jgi:phosphate transport system permease protein|nr:phosphate ABC transporter permease PstA [bacterium]